MPATANKHADNRNNNILKSCGQEGKHICQYAGVDGGEDILEIFDDGCPKNRSEQRSDAAKNGHQHNFTRGRPLHTLGTGQRVGHRQQCPGQPCIHSRYDKGRKQIGPRIDTGVIQTGLV